MTVVVLNLYFNGRGKDGEIAAYTMATAHSPELKNK